MHRVGFIPEKHENRHGRRLGRHIHFDERSRNHRVSFLDHQTDLVSATWERKLPPLDQGQLGMCTCAALVGCLATEPICSDGVADAIHFNEDLARSLYQRATQLDSIVGEWPSEDTGSSVLAAMQAAKEKGLIAGYKWCLSTMDVLKTLSHLGAVEVGFEWRSGFDNPDATGLVKLGGQVEGGHAFELIAIDVERKLVGAINSWGFGWGQSGRFWFSFEDLDHLMRKNGEACFAVVPGPSNA